MNTTKDKSKTHPDVDVANERETGKDNTIELPYDVRAEIIPVSASLISEVSMRYKEPDIPMWFNEAKDRNEPNEADPNYIKQLEEVNRKRGEAAMDAMIMFGVRLIDGLPEDEIWLDQLRFLEMRGDLDLSEYDFDNALTKEFLFKRYICVSTNILDLVTEASGISPEEVEQEEASFQSNEAR